MVVERAFNNSSRGRFKRESKIRVLSLEWGHSRIFASPIRDCVEREDGGKESTLWAQENRA